METKKLIYNSSIFENDKLIKDKYICIVIEYFRNIVNKNFSNFIIIRGLDTITHVFNIFLYYTQHLETTYIYSQKSLYLYIEFIEQIAFDKNSFLQLSSIDAVRYVYKKSIYEIKQNNCKKNDNVQRHQSLYVFYDYCKSILYIITNKLELEYIKKVEDFLYYSVSLDYDSYENSKSTFLEAVTSL